MLYIFIFQEVHDLNPQVVILMLQGDCMMVIIPVESENHHVTTHTLHEIMTVATHWLQVLTTGKGAWKITLSGMKLCGFAFHVVYNVCFVHICTWRKNSIWLITKGPAIANFIPFLHNMNVSNIMYNRKYQLSFKVELLRAFLSGTVTFHISKSYMDCADIF